MKYIIMVTLLLASSLTTFAQDGDNMTDSNKSTNKSLLSAKDKNNYFTDLGLSFSSGLPGMSVTYSRKLTKRFGLGAGAQGYFNSGFDKNLKPVDHLVPAVFADLRWTWQQKHSQTFLLADFGLNIYRGYDVEGTSTTRYAVEHNNGIYQGLGFGYMRRLEKAGISPYLSLKYATDSYMMSDRHTGHEYTIFSLNATLVLSAGIKF